MASPATETRRPGDRASVAAHAARRTQRPHQASVGSPRLGAASSSVDHRPVDVGHEADRVEHPLVEGADGRRWSRRRPAPARSRRAPTTRTGRLEHDVRRDVALLDGRSTGPDPSSTTRPPAGGGAGQTDCRPSSRTTLAARTGCSNRATTRYPSPTGWVRNAFIGGHSGRGTSPGDDGSDATHTATTGARTACGTTAARRSARSATATSTRAYLPAYAGSGRTTAPLERRRGRRREDDLSPPWSRNARTGSGRRQTSAGAHDGRRRTSGRSARGSQLVATWSMTCTPGGATIRSSPGTSSPRPSASAV